jgi:hypothetical protein
MSNERDSILFDLHEELEAGASGARVREIANVHPGMRDDILAFAAEWAVSNCVTNRARTLDYSPATVTNAAGQVVPAVELFDATTGATLAYHVLQPGERSDTVGERMVAFYQR